MTSDGGKKFHNWFLEIMVLCSFLAVAASFYFFFFKKDFDFIVETSCDPAHETCFQRDCSDPDNCPPNGLSNFKRYSLSASDFHMCENEDCTNACQTGAISCEQIPCTEDLEAGESCISPAATNDE